jgi:hypothetical protein
MDKNLFKLGQPDIQVDKLQIWVHGRESLDEDCLRVTIHRGTEDSAVGEVLESTIFLSDLAHLRKELQKIVDKQKNELGVQLAEPYLCLSFAASDNKSVDEIKVKIDITPNKMFEMRGYIFESGKSELSKLISQIDAILKRYPPVENSKD